jgi:hypothetical protein
VCVGVGVGSGCGVGISAITRTYTALRFASTKHCLLFLHLVTIPYNSLAKTIQDVNLKRIATIY